MFFLCLMVDERQFALLLVRCKEAAERDGLHFKPIDLRWKVIVYVFYGTEELGVVQSGELRELVSGITILDLLINLSIFNLGGEGIFPVAYFHVADVHVADFHVADFHAADFHAAYVHVEYCHVACERFSYSQDRFESGRRANLYSSLIADQPPLCFSAEIGFRQI